MTSLIDKLQAAKLHISGVLGNSTAYDDGIQKSVEIVRRHNAAQPSDQVIEALHDLYDDIRGRMDDGDKFNPGTLNAIKRIRTGIAEMNMGEGCSEASSQDSKSVGDNEGSSPSAISACNTSSPANTKTEFCEHDFIGNFCKKCLFVLPAGFHYGGFAKGEGIVGKANVIGGDKFGEEGHGAQPGKIKFFAGSPESGADHMEQPRNVVDEEALGKLVGDVKWAVVQHINGGATPLRTELCQLLRPYFPATKPAPVCLEKAAREIARNINGEQFWTSSMFVAKCAAKAWGLPYVE